MFPRLFLNPQGDISRIICLLKILLFYFDVELIYNVVLVLGVQQNDSVIYIFSYIYMCVCVYIYIYIYIYTYIHTQISLIFQILLLYRLLQNIE